MGGLCGSAYETCLNICNSTLHNREGHGWITITQQIDWLELSENRVNRQDGRHLRKSLNSVLKFAKLASLPCAYLQVF